MALTFDQLKKRVGKNIRYYDDTDGWKANRDVTEIDIGDFLNEIYLEEIFPLFASRYPHMFRQKGYLDSWIATGTVDTTSTSTTLVATSSIFTNGMVGLKVYNSTDEETAEIISYTSATTVTLDTTISDDWDGDTIWILGKEFTFGGDATDIYTLEGVEVKYDSTSTDPNNYIKAELRDKEDIFPYGRETGSKSVPYSYLTSVKTSSGLKLGFGVFPGFDEKVTKGVQITYLGQPSALSSSGDIPIVPIQNALIAGTTTRAFEKMQQFKQSGYWMQKFNRALKTDVSRFRPQTSNRPLRLRTDRKHYFVHRRII